MLKREQLRLYLLALLQSDKVNQDPACKQGFLFENCDGSSVQIFDSPAQQIFEDAEATYQLNKDCVAIAVYVSSERYKLLPTKVDSLTINFTIDIIVNAATGHERQNLLDTVQERILHRIYSYARFTDTEDNTRLKSFMEWATNNEIILTVSEQSEFSGSYAVRSLNFSVTTNACIERSQCDDCHLCFDFKNLTILSNEGGCNATN